MKRPFASLAIRRADIAMPTRVRFIQKIAVAHEEECWEWTGSRTQQGYGRFMLHPIGCTTAQRVAYALLVGDLAAGLTVDHLCNNRGCVNPRHLQAVPHRVNAQRAKARITHCKKGHPLALYDGPNFRQRYCPTCKRENGRNWQRRYRAALKEAKA